MKVDNSLNTLLFLICELCFHTKLIVCYCQHCFVSYVWCNWLIYTNLPWKGEKVKYIQHKKTHKVLNLASYQPPQVVKCPKFLKQHRGHDLWVTALYGSVALCVCVDSSGVYFHTEIWVLATKHGTVLSLSLSIYLLRTLRHPAVIAPPSERLKWKENINRQMLLSCCLL